ncbi:MAG: ABC transporter permease [Blastocatellia bacterium]
MQTLLQDLRYGARMLLKRPGFTIIALLSLAFGIGANTAIFSLVNTAALRPLPIAEAERLVSLNNVDAGRMFATFSYPNYRDFRDRNDVFSGLIAYRFAPLSLSSISATGGVNERLWGYSVSGNYFDVLGVRAALGRLIGADDDRMPGAHPVAVVSHKFWQTRFGGAADAVGRNLMVNGRNYTVVGVAPRDFAGTEVIAAPDLWFPMAMQAALEPGDDWLERRGVENLFLQGRLKPGVNRAQAQAAINLVAGQLEREFPAENEGKRVALATPGFMGGMMRGPVLGFLGVLMGVVGLVLLLACTNLANLLLARATERRREIAVRLALGASRFQLIRQLLTESVLLGLAGGVLGLLMAFWLVDLAVAFKPPIDVPLNVDPRIDARVLAFTFLLSIATGVMFGLLPALQATKTDLVSALKDETPMGGARRSWWKSGLIVFQVALSLVLLVSGGLMLRGLQRAETLDLGFDPQNAVELSFDLRLQGYDRGSAREFQKRLLERARALAGVEHAGLASMVPVDLHFGRDAVYIEGQLPERDQAAARAMTNRVSPGYFGAMRTRLLSGREFTEQDNDASPRVAVVNETFARRFWPGEEAVGKRFSVGAADAPKYEVVGVSEDGKYQNLNEEPKPFVYRALWQSGAGTTSLVVRAKTEPGKLIAAVRAELQQLDANLPVAGARTLVEHMSFPLLPARLAAGVLGSFGLVALLLAAIGLYRVMAFAVSSRTREIGVRMALGARSADVLRLVIGDGMKLALAGLALGLAASLALTQLMKTLLFGVSATDPLTFAAVAALLALVALAACWIPARRAAKVDPMVALRCE